MPSKQSSEGFEVLLLIHWQYWLWATSSQNCFQIVYIYHRDFPKIRKKIKHGDFLFLEVTSSVLYPCRSLFLVVFSTKHPCDLFASKWTWKLTLLNLGCLVPIYMLLQVWNILLLFFPIILLALIMVCLFVLTCVVGWEHSSVCLFFVLFRYGLFGVFLLCMFFGVWEERFGFGLFDLWVEYILNALFIIIILYTLLIITISMFICLMFYVKWKHFKLIIFFDAHKKTLFLLVLLF